MNLRGFRVATVVAGLLTFGMAAETAQAGFDLADTVTAGNGITSPGVRFNGVVGATFGTLALPPGLSTTPGENRVLVTAPGFTAPFPEFATLDFAYAAPRAVDFIRGDATYDLVLQMGDVVIEPLVGSLLLATMSFSENGGITFSPGYFVPQPLTAANSGRLLQINIPEAAIPPTERNTVNVVRLTFVIQGAGTSFGINAVANPEPGTMALFGLGALGLVGLVRRRRKKRLVVETAA